MTELITLPNGNTLTQTTTLKSFDGTNKHPGHGLAPHDDTLWLPDGAAVVEHSYVENSVLAPMPSLPSSIEVGALQVDLSANRWAAFSRQRAQGWSMNNVVTNPIAVSIDANNVAHLSLTSQGGTTYGGYMGTSSGDGGQGYMLPDKSIWETDAAVPFAAWCAIWAVGPNWPAGGEEDVLEILGNKDTSNEHGTGVTNNSGPIGVQTALRRTYTLVRNGTTDSVYWGGLFVRSYPTNDGGVPQGLIFNVGQGTIGTTMDIYSSRVWALG